MHATKKISSKLVQQFLIILFIIPLCIPWEAHAASGCCQIVEDRETGSYSYATLEESTCTERNTDVNVLPHTFEIGRIANADESGCMDDLGGSLPKNTNPLDNPKLSVSIPNLNLTPITCNDGGCSVNWLADYINALYKYGLGIIGILAVIAMMIGGILWVTAAGNDERIGDAKKWIGGSIMGVIIALTAYTMLSIINPALTKLSPIKIRSIARFELQPLPPGGDNEETPEISNQPGSYPSVNGSCFPVAKGSYVYSSWGFGDPRSNGSRCHAGVDLYTQGKREGVAIADGTVVGVYHFYNCHGGSVDAIIVDHGGYVINYGEVDTGKAYVKAGQKVKAGDVLGYYSHCDMMHFELYTKGTTSNTPWYPPKGSKVSGKNACRDKYMSTKPANLLDPTSTLKDLEGKQCGK